MELSQLFKECRTFRKFKQEEIPEKDIDAIFEDLRYAHSGNNRQTLSFVAVCTKEKRDAVCSLVHFAAILPREIADPKEDERPTAYIMIVGQKEHTRVIDIDTGIAAEMIMESAYAHGIGSCMMLNYNVTEVNKVLALSDEQSTLMVIAMGYPSHSSEAVDIGEDGNTAYTCDEHFHFKVPKKTAKQIARKL
jgi:FMN reductase [NAD(P)H]